MENGLLLIGLVREIPEALKPRTIIIASNKGVGTKEPMQIMQDEVQTRAA
jgi:hypothetical protein